MLTGGSTGSSWTSTDYPHVVGDQVISKHPAQRNVSVEVHRKGAQQVIKVLLTQQGGAEIFTETL